MNITGFDRMSLVTGVLLRGKLRERRHREKAGGGVGGQRGGGAPRAVESQQGGTDLTFP